MALNWNIEKCHNYKELTTEEAWPTTDTLIWLTMAVGIGTITEKNYKEFYARVHLLELLTGTFKQKRVGDKWEPMFTTLEDVKRRIGLTTNVGTMPRSAFLKLKVGRYFREITESGTQE